MTTLTNFILILAGVTTALMAGLFFAWSYSVTPGLARVTDATYIESFQAMNRAILNPLFFLCFFGAAFLLPITTYMHYTHNTSLRFWLLLVATITYLVGVMGVTIFGNVPMNEALDAFHLKNATTQEVAQQRANFETMWNKLNLIRTVANSISIALLLSACLSDSET